MLFYSGNTHNKLSEKGSRGKIRSDKNEPNWLTKSSFSVIFKVYVKIVEILVKYRKNRQKINNLFHRKVVQNGFFS